MTSFKLHGNHDWGSVLTEAELAFYGLDYDFAPAGMLFEDEAAHQRLLGVNPSS